MLAAVEAVDSLSRLNLRRTPLLKDFIVHLATSGKLPSLPSGKGACRPGRAQASTRMR